MKRIALFSLMTLVLGTGCSRHPATSELFNDAAAIPNGAPVQPLAWRVITSSIDPVHQTMSTLFGNDIAIDSARTPAHAAYPAGSVLALVTWSEKEDEHWFGARIPKQFQSMEIVRVTQGADGKAATSYERREWPSLQKASDAAADAEAKQNSILGQRASVMP
jgi:hypothetical protein